jgi:hypothetical protein
MKNSIVILSFILTFLQGQTQTNLEYSETIQIELTGTTISNGVVASLPVVIPEGQTWKIESIMLSRKSIGSGTRDYQISGDLKLILDDNLLYVNTTNNEYNFPFWMKSGNHLFEIIYANTWTAFYTGRATLSVLVFNIVEP